MCKYCLQWNHGEYRFHITWIRCWGFLGRIWFQFNLSEGKEYLHHKRVPLNSWHDSLKAEILVKLSENPTWTISSLSLISLSKLQEGHVKFLSNLFHFLQSFSNYPTFLSFFQTPWFLCVFSVFWDFSLGVFATQIWHHLESISNWSVQKSKYPNQM